MNINKAVSDWFFGPFILMTISYLLWYFAVIPFETTVLSDIPFMASFLFLPHFARVFSIWYFGYKAVFSTVAAQSICYTLIKGIPEIELAVFQSIIVGALAVVVALWLLNLLKIQKPASAENTTTNWKGLLFLALLASLINAIGAVLLRAVDATLEDKIVLMLRIVLGDTVSVFVGLFMLMVVFRLLRGIADRKIEN